MIVSHFRARTLYNTLKQSQQKHFPLKWPNMSKLLNLGVRVLFVVALGKVKTQLLKVDPIRFIQVHCSQTKHCQLKLLLDFSQ